MTLEEVRLLMLATLAAGPGDLLDCYSEPIRGGGGDRIYTVELVNEGGTRWFGLHGQALVDAPEIVVLTELRQRFAAPAELSPAA